jgi:iron complex outermembrane recepter protein
MRFFLLAFLLPASFACAQSLDSTQQLQPVTIQAYATDRTLEEVAASVAYIGPQSLERFSNTSILPALNVVPGVRMEERSPGSYRFSIRGSLLRSPFGIRNVKVYWNGLPFTDGGGNTYLNLIDFNSIGSLEVIKGPGGSLYGAGTGGVILLNSPIIRKNQFEIQALAGSYGLRRYAFSGQLQSEKLTGRILYAHQESNGYREQTRMTRDAIQADLTWALSAKTSLSGTLLYSDLFYETPGGLTLTQFNENPRQARPAGGPNRGAVEQQASINNQTPFAGISLEHQWTEQWTSTIGVYGSTSDFLNPAIRNEEIREETNYGARLQSQFAFGKEKKSKITFGGEFQGFDSPIKIYGNSFGLRDTLQTADVLTSNQILVFAQAEYDLPQNFFLTIGGSLGFTKYTFSRTYPNTVSGERNLDPAFSPRLALLNRVTPGMTIFGSVSKGYSPPGLAELFPSRAIWDTEIRPEEGTNLEVGLKGHRFRRSLEFELTLYRFKLDNTLVIRRQPDNAEYFVNAGETLQRGIEASLNWHPIRNEKTLVSDLRIFSTYAYNHYRFKNYFQGTSDYSGKMITGIPPVVNNTGFDLTLRKRFYINTTAMYTDHIPLNDDNSVFASQAFIVGSRIGYRTPIKSHILEIFTGGDNLLDKVYSLGNDLNAVGGRYFNSAAPRNFYAGLKFTVAK